MLNGVIDILQWKGDQRVALDRAESAYTSLLAGRLGARLGQLQDDKPELLAKIVGLLAQLDAPRLRRVLLAPETSSRLLWDHPGRCDDRELWQYLVDALEVDAAQQTFASAPRKPTGVLQGRWSALGDLCVDEAGAVIVSQPRLAGLVVDADSPAAICFDGSFLTNGPMRLQYYVDRTAKQAAMEKLERAMCAIGLLPDVADFVRRFTLVANIVVDTESSRFSSGSSGEYIGRSMFMSVHLPSVDTENLADSLVHEAIHSLLYMHEACEPWVVHEELLPSDAAVDSPWTGSRLLLRNFLQACFVWFGLTHFWTLAKRGSGFSIHRIEEHLATARRGFLKGALVNRLVDHTPYLAPRLVDLIRTMQEDVVSGTRHSTAVGER